MSVESDLKQLEELGYKAPAAQKPVAQKPVATPKTAAPAAPAPKPTLAESAKAKLSGNSLPVTLGIALLALGAGMTLYKVTR